MTDIYKELEKVLMNMPPELRAELQRLFPAGSENHNEGIDCERLLDAVHSYDSVWTCINEYFIDKTNRDYLKNCRNFEAQLRKYDLAIRKLKKAERLTRDPLKKTSIKESIFAIEIKGNTLKKEYDAIIESYHKNMDQSIQDMEHLNNLTLEEKIMSIISERRKK